MPEETSSDTPQINNPQNPNVPPPTQPPTNNLPPKKPPFLTPRILIIFGIFLIVVLLVFTGMFILLPKTEKQKSQTPITSNSTPVITPTPVPEDALEAPELYPEFEWEEFIESELNKSLSESALYSQKGNWGSIRMNGKEWTASKDNLDRDSMEVLLTGFDVYYNSELTQRGWSYIYEDEQYNLVPLSADGPGGSIWGYIKVNDGKLRVILLQKLTPIEDFGGVATCPCSIGFRVFVSDIESIEELVKRIN